MTGQKINFEPPLVVGALCERESQIPLALKKVFARFGPGWVLLPFEVEKKHLKNTITCMKLMDIHGLIIFGLHKRNVCRHLPRFNGAAKKSGSVDIVKRQGKGFLGLKVDFCAKRNSKAGVGVFCQTCVEILTPKKK